MIPTQRLLDTCVIAVACAALAGAARPLPEELLNEREQRALGKEIAAFVDAMAKTRGIDEARDGVYKLLDKTQKRLRVGDGLSLVQDLQKSCYYAREYGDKTVKKGKVEEYAEDSSGRPLDFAVWTPKSYKAEKGPYPLVLLIPGEGERPKQHIDEHWIDPELRELAVLAACAMPAAVERWTELGDRNESGGVAVVMRVLNEMLRTVAVDVDRIFICGWGNPGVNAGVNVARLYATRFAGVIGRAGDMKPTPAGNFRNLPSYFAGGGANCGAFAEDVTKRGFANCTLAPAATEKDVMAWMGAQVRNAHPSAVTLEPATALNKSAYWLQLERFDADGASIEAVIDRASNTIDIKSAKVERVFLYYNDLLVDIDKPIKVVCNGKASEYQLARNLGVMLDLYYKSADSGRLYTAYKDYDIVPSERAEE